MLALVPSDAAARNNAVSFVLRLALAVIFIYHGWEKVKAPGDYGGASWASRMWDARAQQLPEPLTFAIAQVAVAWGELLGGLALGIGLLTRVAAVGMIVIQAGAVWLVTYSQGFIGGYEYNIALMVMCLAVVILGGARCSVDWMIDHARKKGRAATAPPSEPALAGR